ncbi:MAG: methyltransferase domain-containing protein [Clostridia bacterium]|nr:methyltransferase domain-containing protein [Clostridia bacterium]
MLNKTDVLVKKPGWLSPTRDRLSAKDKNMLRLAVINEDDNVLQIPCENGTLLTHIAGKYRCRINGATNDYNQMRSTHAMNPDINIVYCGRNEIPWRDNSFSVLFSGLPFTDITDAAKLFNEAMRVLKAGGQFICLLPVKPALYKQAIYSTPNNVSMAVRTLLTRHEAMAAMSEAGFQSVSWHMRGLFNAITVGWKKVLES